MPAQVNATLIAVHGPDAPRERADDWDAPVAPGAAPSGLLKWQGIAEAYYRESTEERTGPAGVADVVEVRTLYVDTAAAIAASIETGDVLTIAGPFGVDVVARAARVSRSTLPAALALVDSTAIDLALA